MGEIKTAFGYCRLSEEEAGKGVSQSESIKNQEKIISTFCSEKEIKLIKIFKEIKSGGKERKVFNQMLEEAKIEKPSHVIVKDWSRFSRSYTKSELTETLLNQHNISIIPILDANLNETGKRVKWFIDDLYRLNAKLNIEKVHSLKLEQNIVLNRPPFGYKIDRKHKIFVPDKNADKVREIYSLAESGLKVKEIAIKCSLNQLKVYRILRNRTYLGKFSYQSKEYNGKHQPLITEETFNNVQAKIKPFIQKKQSLSL